MRVKLVSFAAEHFNNNGDQGNIDVLKFHLEKSGVAVEEFGQSQAESADFLLVGDCSRAALRFYKPGLDALVPALLARLEAGNPTLIVGTSYEYLSSQIGLGDPMKVSRVSDFASVMHQGMQIVGYSNSDTDLPLVQTRGNFIATKFYGPVLALNPELLQRILQALGGGLHLSEQMADDVERVTRQISA